MKPNLKQKGLDRIRKLQQKIQTKCRHHREMLFLPMIKSEIDCH
jgi:hypothetical protein